MNTDVEAVLRAADVLGSLAEPAHDEESAHDTVARQRAAVAELLDGLDPEERARIVAAFAAFVDIAPIRPDDAD